MANYIKGIRTIIAKGIKTKCIIIIGKIYMILPLHYTKLSRISFERWHAVESGKLHLLNKFNINYVPYQFNQLYLDMMFQKPAMNLSQLRNRADMHILFSMAARTQNKGILFKATALQKEILNLAKKNEDTPDTSVNDIIDAIELTFERIGTIDPSKISASRVYSLYEKARLKVKDINKRLNKKKNVNNSK